MGQDVNLSQEICDSRTCSRLLAREIWKVVPHQIPQERLVRAYAPLRPPLDRGFGGAGLSVSFGWSPMTVLRGQNEKAGHFLQPTARATGQRVILCSLVPVQPIPMRGAVPRLEARRASRLSGVRRTRRRTRGKVSSSSLRIAPTHD